VAKRGAWFSLVLGIACLGLPAAAGQGRSERQSSSTIESAVVRKPIAVLQATAINRVEPEYPGLARAAGVSGTVLVEVVINGTGAVSSAVAVSGHPLLRYAAVSAAREWKWPPPIEAGRPVKLTGLLSFAFTAEKGDLRDSDRVDNSAAQDEDQTGGGDESSDLGTDDYYQGPPRVTSVSPWEISRAVRKARRGWAGSGQSETADLRYIWSVIGVDPNYFEECGLECRAAIFRVNLTTGVHPLIVLRLQWGVDYCRYLFFRRGQDERWSFLGFIDHDFSRYDASPLHVAAAAGQKFLVIRDLVPSLNAFDTGGQARQTWYRITDRGVRPVLLIPSGRNQGQWWGGLTFHSRTIVHSENGSGQLDTLRITFRVSYSEHTRSTPLFSITQDAYFRWNEGLSRFVFDAWRSGISESELETIFWLSDDESKARRTFLKYNLSRLMEIASGTEGPAIEWLRQFLDGCDDSSERTALLNVLPEEAAPQSPR
jgi:TonB family protein